MQPHDPAPASTSELRRLSGLLQTVAALAAVAASQHALAPRAHAGPAQIDAMLGAVSTVVAQTVRDPRPRFRVLDLSPDVRDLWIALAYPQGSQLDIWIDVRASAQLGGLLLSMGDTKLDLGAANSMFTVAIGGVLGSKAFSFASGTTLPQVAAAISYHSPATGVDAVLSGTGIRLQSQEYGSNQFVSVRILSHGNLAGFYTGIYTLSHDNFRRAEPWPWYPMNSYAAASGVGDLGRDVYALINGVPCESSGTVLQSHSWFRGQIDLTTGPALGSANAETVGAFRAFRLFWY